MVTSVTAHAGHMSSPSDPSVDGQEIDRIADDIAYWEDVRDRAFQTGHHWLGRVVNGLAKDRLAARARLVIEGPRRRRSR